MLTFGSQTNTPTYSLQPNLSIDDDSKIPFLFAAVPHQLFAHGLKPTTVGVYTGLAKYVNWRAQMTVEGRKVITGWTIPVSQEKLAELLNSSRQTINSHIKILADAGVIELKRSFLGCYQYRLVAYKEGIEEIEQAAKQSQESLTNPVVPTPEQVEEYIQTDTPVVDVKKFDTACQDSRHIKEMLRNETVAWTGP